MERSMMKICVNYYESLTGQSFLESVVGRWIVCTRALVKCDGDRRDHVQHI
jgi:hypothetical protein